MTTFDSTRGATPRLPGDDFNVPFAEAIAWARERKAVLPSEFYGARLQAVRARSFAIAGLSALDQVQQVADSLAEATAKGTTLREWQRNLPDSVFELGKARRELIFRNAVQTHYGIGRTIQQRENAASRPYLMWDAINDSRTRPTHAAMDGHIAPIDDPIWKQWSPPAGHNSLLPHQRVSGNAFVGLKAWYAGPVAEIVGQTGARLSVTAQHPILTRRGWVAAQDVKVGDQLVAYGRPVGSGAVPADLDEHDTPPTIEEVFNALASRARGAMPRSALNLHGDAEFVDGNVDVVAVDSELMSRINSVAVKRGNQFVLALTNYAACLAERAGAAFVVAWRQLCGLAGAAGRLQPAGRGSSNSDRYAGSLQVRRQTFAIYAESRLKTAQVRAIAIEVADFIRNRLREPGGRPSHGGARDQRGGFRFGPLGDTAFADVFVGGFEVNPNAFADAVKAHAGSVEVEDVVDVRRSNWAGHVYDLETASGNILAYGNTGTRHYVVSNCRCTRIALSDAQARARGHPKADPGVEPDAGWEGDPTEGNEDLVRVIQARQASCMTTFAAKKARARGLWCDDGAASDRMRAMATALDHDAPMPPPRVLSLPLLPAGTSEPDAFRAFMRAMGEEFAREIEVSPIPGVTLSVSRQMFTDHKTGESKADKRGRAIYMNYIAETVLRPDETWLQEGDFGDETLRLLARFARGDRVFGVVAAFQRRVGIWEGWTGYNVPRMSYFQSKRRGVLVFRRPET